MSTQITTGDILLVEAQVEAQAENRHCTETHTRGEA